MSDLRSSLADLLRNAGHHDAVRCTICDRATIYRKPLCPEHITLSPIAKRIEADLAREAVDRTAALPRLDSIGVGDLLAFLFTRPHTPPELAHRLQFTDAETEAHVRVTLGARLSKLEKGRIAITQRGIEHLLKS